jgi:hypothetical protein
MPFNANDVPFTSNYGQLILEQVKLIFQSSISKATQSTYASGWKKFNHYCILTHCSPWRPSDAIIIGFIAHLSFPNPAKPHGLSIPTLKAYLSSSNHFQISWGFPNIITNRPLVERAVRGFKRLRGSTSNQKFPITLDIISYIHKIIPHNATYHIVCWCVCVLGMVGLLRLGELLPKHDDIDNTIFLSNINWVNESHFTLRLNSSKTDPFRKSVVIHYFANTKSVACPVTALRKLLSIHTHDQPLFFVSSINQLLSRNMFIDWLKLTLIVVNTQFNLSIDPSKYSGHSLRRGGATSLHIRGISEQTIKILGRWRSDAFRRYIDSPIEQLRSAQLQLIPSPYTQTMDFNFNPSSIWDSDE